MIFPSYVSDKVADLWVNSPIVTAVSILGRGIKKPSRVLEGLKDLFGVD
jgi:hypothetical protein